MTHETGFLERRVSVGGVERPYVLFVPHGRTGALPVVVFLHGRGECGDDGLKPLSVGFAPAMTANPARWGCAAVFPQKAKLDEEWFDERAYLNAVLSAVRAEIAVDSARCYLAGLSQGGRGALRLAKHLAWRFAAVVSVCGWCDVETAVKELADTPVWAFHGALDPLIPSARSEELVEALRDAGGDAQITLYPEVAHDAWVNAFAEGSLPAWLLGRQLR